MGRQVSFFAGQEDDRELRRYIASQGLYMVPAQVDLDPKSVDDPAKYPGWFISFIPPEKLHPHGSSPPCFSDAIDPLIDFTRSYYEPPYLIAGRIYWYDDNEDFCELTRPYYLRLVSWMRSNWHVRPAHGLCLGPDALRLVREEGAQLISFPPGVPIEIIEVPSGRSRFGGYTKAVSIPVETWFDTEARLPRRTRLGYVETMELLRRLGFLPPGDIPSLPPRRPRYEDPESFGLEFHRGMLEDCALDHLSLPRTFFCRALVEGVSFHKSDLSESSLCWSDFIDMDFTEADLRGSDLRRSNFENVRFVRSDLRNTDLRGSDFRNCDFTGAVMAGAMLMKDQADIFAFSGEQRRSIHWMTDEGEEPGGG